MAKVYLSSGDPVITRVYTEKEVIELFGDDFLDEYGIIIPDELLAQYQDVYKAYWKIQEKLDEYLTK